MNEFSTLHGPHNRDTAFRRHTLVAAHNNGLTQDEQGGEAEGPALCTDYTVQWEVPPRLHLSVHWCLHNSAQAPIKLPLPPTVSVGLIVRERAPFQRDSPTLQGARCLLAAK